MSTLRDADLTVYERPEVADYGTLVDLTTASGGQVFEDGMGKVSGFLN